jgi:hypothetical protein
MVCLGEGLMPKGGETQEMGSNPLLGFGRIYARPQVAKFLDDHVQKLINAEDYSWEDFRSSLRNAGITIWGAAIDTLENTSRFAQGKPTGPLTVFHLFDQPLAITKPYEGYIGNLVLPREIVGTAAKESLQINFLTPRRKILHAIKLTYPDINNENIHVWTLRGKSRVPRIGKLWDEWQESGVHLVEDDWDLPTGYKAFTDSGTYAPTFLVGTWQDNQKERHLFIVDGYAASAEAIQAASLYPILDLDVSLAVFSSTFKLSYDQELHLMHLDPDDSDFAVQLSDIFGKELEEETVQRYRDNILQAKDAGIPLLKRIISADDFLPEKKWNVMAISGFMLPDPYTGISGVKQISDDTYEVAARLSTLRGDKLTTFKLRLLESHEESRLIFNPLLNRFMRGENYRERPVKISDSGRIRNELHTLCSEALEHSGPYRLKLHFDKIPKDIISPEDQTTLRKILEWYKENHPIWFKWLELA